MHRPLPARSEAMGRRRKSPLHPPPQIHRWAHSSPPSVSYRRTSPCLSPSSLRLRRKLHPSARPHPWPNPPSRVLPRHPTPASCSTHSTPPTPSLSRARALRAHPARVLMLLPPPARCPPPSGRVLKSLPPSKPSPRPAPTPASSSPPPSCPPRQPPRAAPLHSSLRSLLALPHAAEASASKPPPSLRRLSRASRRTAHRPTTPPPRPHSRRQLSFSSSRRCPSPHSGAAPSGCPRCSTLRHASPPLSCHTTSTPRAGPRPSSPWCLAKPRRRGSSHTAS